MARNTITMTLLLFCHGLLRA